MATGRIDFPTLASSLTTHKEAGEAPINHVRKYEATAWSAYYTIKKVSIVETVIVVGCNKPYLGRSPGEYGVLKITCPYTARNEIISSATVPYLKTDGNTFLLVQNHEYYFQVRGNLMCTGRE